QAAKRLGESSAFHGMEAAARIAHLVRLLRYMTAAGSPCSWQRFMRQRHPGAPVRLWHIANNAISMSFEMEKNNWWPISTGHQDAPSPQQEQEVQVWEPPARLPRRRDVMVEATEVDGDPEPTVTPDIVVS